MLLSWINTTLSDFVLFFIVGVKSTKQAWDLLNKKYASTTPAHIMSLKGQLNLIKKGTQTMSDYLLQFKTMSDQLVACGSLVSNDDIILLFLDGLPPSYRQFCSSLCIHARTSTLTLDELHTLLICEELAFVDEPLTEQPNAMAAFQPPRSQPNRWPLRCGHHHSTGRGQPPCCHYTEVRLLPSPPQSGPYRECHNNRPTCQICQKPSYLAIDYYHRMNYAYHDRHPPKKIATMVFTTMPPSSTWYSDTGASHHLTLDIENLHISSPYDGTDNVHVGNGQGYSPNHKGYRCLDLQTLKVYTSCYVLFDEDLFPFATSNPHTTLTISIRS
ncbi:hypothetical protein NE237_004685 [Protea cynaroides]|uniref:Retroviral polymerase SH3-like domain-containing protein n=1 Tax=Protea cynaroides TaxID=273540 RepID=A0A9Q0KJY6_9MAGN|nr:hypothetical protein NE237_004685 [Protea cynaroides]